MSSNNIKCAFNLFWSSSSTFKQSSLIFYGDQEILPQFLQPPSSSILQRVRDWLCKRQIGFGVRPLL